MARVTVVAMSVCLSVKSHLTSGASVFCENAATYSASNAVKKVVAFSLKLLGWRDRALPPLDGHNYTHDQPFFLRINTHAHCAYASSPRFTQCDAPCRKLSLHFSFTMIILGLESSSYLAGYQFVPRP